ncbi:MAG: zinc-ribbon domain-containing protein, partial [Endomicrobiaceae bacterium]|nr:zinc-ribbon domain-containing protein [Endomicrobiaceae bacterium]
RKVWWICKHGHEWYASVASRTNMQSGCPVCARLATVSYPESIVSYYIQSLDTPCILQASNASIPQLENMSVDLYLPAYNLAIEYDGSFYHPEGIERKSRDYKKDAVLMSSGINLIRIRDDVMLKKPFTCTHLKHYVSYRYSCENQDHENLKFVVQDIITNQLHLPNKLDFDLVRDNNEINKIKDCMNQSVNIQISK